MSNYSVFIDPQADRKLAAHIEFMARVSETAAMKLYKTYEEALNSLKENPTIYPQYITHKPIDAILKYKLFNKRYRIVFEIIEYAVYIYDIQDCRQDSDKNLV